MAKRKGTSKGPRADEIYQIHVSLQGIEPLIWRRILVPGAFTLEALHSVIQLTMGWRMSHLYDFDINGERYSCPNNDDDQPVKDVAAALISTSVRSEKAFIYTYDFGDGWRHDVKVEDFKKREDIYSYPVCVDGENACPPEDCGGLPGYENLKEVIADPKHAEHEEMMRWLGGVFEPTSFDVNRINRDMLWAIDWSLEVNDQGLYLPFNYEDGTKKKPPRGWISGHH